MFGEWELVILWDTDEMDIYEYHTESEAVDAGQNMKMALGNQIEWYGVRHNNKMTSVNIIL